MLSSGAPCIMAEVGIELQSLLASLDEAGQSSLEASCMQLSCRASINMREADELGHCITLLKAGVTAGHSSLAAPLK